MLLFEILDKDLEIYCHKSYEIWPKLENFFFSLFFMIITLHDTNIHFYPFDTTYIIHDVDKKYLKEIYSIFRHPLCLRLPLESVKISMKIFCFQID